MSEEHNKLNDRRKQPVKRVLWLVISLGTGLIVWHLVSTLLGLPAFILPSPVLVWQRFQQSLASGQLIYHTIATLLEVLAGLLLGGLAATILGYFLSKFPALEKLLSPYLVASQSIPIVAIAPLLVIWFGAGISSSRLAGSTTGPA